MITLVLLFLVLLYFSLNSLKKDGNRKVYITTASIVLIFLSTFRHEGVGVDTLSYVLAYEQNANVDWNGLIVHFADNYLGVGGYQERDPGYHLLNKFLYTLVPYGRFILFISSAFLFYCMGRFLYANTINLRQVFFFYVFYIIFFYSYIPNSAIRQTFAISFVVLGYCQLQHNKLVRFIVLVIIGSLFHKTALLALILVPLYYINNVKLIYRFGAIVYIYLIFFNQQVAEFLIAGDSTYGSYLADSYYTENSKPYMVIVLMLIFYFIIYFVMNKDENQKTNKFFYYGSALAVVLTPLIWVSPSLLRLVAFFCPFLGICIANSLERYNIKRYLFVVIIAVFLFKSFSSGRYRFMWQEMQLHERYDRISY